MKKILSSFLLPSLIIISISGCFKDCKDEIPACADTVPTGELCQAFFQTWFYNADMKSCELKGYSGCEAAGFATEEECLSCKCD